MKTLKSIIPVLALLIAFNTVQAFDKNDDRLTKNYAISSYVDAVTNGKIESLADVVDKNTKFCVMQGKNMISYSKDEVLNHLAGQKNIKQSCITTTTVVDDNSELAVVRVDMQYANFIRSNYITIARTSNGWKITNVCSVFK